MLKNMAQFTARFLREEDGPTSVEYAVMLALIIVTMIGVLLTTGELQRAMFVNTGSDMNQVMFPNN